MNIRPINQNLMFRDEREQIFPHFEENEPLNVLEFLEQERMKILQLRKLQVESRIVIKSYETMQARIRHLNNHDYEQQSSSLPKIFNKKYYEVKTKLVEFDDKYVKMDPADCKTFLHIFIDKTMDEQLKAEKSLREYQRMMLSSVAHEFRNPLNCINGNLELISMVTKQDQIKKFTETAKNSCMMLNSYVEDILDLGRIEGGGFHLNPMQFKVSSLTYEIFTIDL